MNVHFLDHHCSSALVFTENNLCFTHINFYRSFFTKNTSENIVCSCMHPIDTIISTASLLLIASRQLHNSDAETAEARLAFKCNLLLSHVFLNYSSFKCTPDLVRFV